MDISTKIVYSSCNHYVTSHTLLHFIYWKVKIQTIQTTLLISQPGDDGVRCWVEAPSG